MGNLISLYLNGDPVASGTLPIDTPQGTPFYLGMEPVDNGSRLDGEMDEAVVYNRALSSQEIKLLYQVGTPKYASWLTLTSTAGTIPANRSLRVKVILNATNLEPGTYQTNVMVTSSNPLDPMVTIPITLQVQYPGCYRCRSH